MTEPGDVPALTGPPPLIELVEIMGRLRAECAWKSRQTHRSLARYLLEETHETLEAIDEGERTGDWDHLREELGDLLLQVYFHAAVAAERGDFTVQDVAADLVAKLVRRNPHVFGDAPGGDAEAINEAWETIKRTEKQRTHPVEGLPASLPALLYADKVIDRLGRDGSPVTPDPASSDPVSSELASADLGERLLALAVEAHAAGVDAEQLLRDAVRRRTDAVPPNSQ